MATTIDHLRVDHRITVLRDFVDAKGKLMRAGDSGVLTKIDWDQIRNEIVLEIKRDSGNMKLVFDLAAKTGPRNGRMRDYFEIGEDVTPPRVIPAYHDPSLRQMIIPPPERKPATMNTTAWARAAQSMEGPDRLEAIEEEIRRSIDHIGVAASIAEMYAQRMRMFQRAGNELRAIAAFKLAVDWMGTYASWATSGGEGAALSYERDQFRAALAREFGYDPTEPKP
ncbi:MAG: hypothetical protein QM813_01605 [Verrucomicrobiota bacterium]